MTHDPLQAYATFGPYSAVPNLLTPFGGQPNYTPYPAGLNPLAVLQQLQLASILGAQNPLGLPLNPLLNIGNPWTGGLPNQQVPQIHPLAAQALGLYAGLGQQTLYPQIGLGQGYSNSPFGQTGLPLAPQTWIGQTGLAGQIHPLYQQLAARALGVPGMHPGIGF